LYAPPNIFVVIKSRKRLVGYVARIGEMRILYKRVAEKGRDLFEYLGLDGRIILERVLKNLGGCGLDASSSG
jgi:hypothetical protein